MLFADLNTAQSTLLTQAMDAIRRRLEGEPPTPEESRAIAEAILGDSLAAGYARTQEEVAEVWREQIGPITSRTVRNWTSGAEIEAGPQGWPLVAIAVYAAQAETRGGRQTSEEKAALELEQLRLKVSTERRKADREAGLSIPRADVDRLYGATQMETRTALLRLPQAAPVVATMDERQVRQHMVALCDEILHALTKGDHAQHAADVIDGLFALAEACKIHADELPDAVAVHLNRIEAPDAI